MFSHTALITLIVISTVTYSKTLNENINYNGPFNTNTRIKAPRRLIQNLAASLLGDVRFYHGVASGDPTDTEILVCTVYIYRSLLNIQQHTSI